MSVIGWVGTGVPEEGGMKVKLTLQQVCGGGLKRGVRDRKGYMWVFSGWLELKKLLLWRLDGTFIRLCSSHWLNLSVFQIKVLTMITNRALLISTKPGPRGIKKNQYNKLSSLIPPINSQISRNKGWEKLHNKPTRTLKVLIKNSGKILDLADIPLGVCPGGL